ncbi:MAG: SH3 domain-containing protein [Anaerolineae bacterium]|nr:SH3 domain-containing protein [Anaerolineae bacterium]
MKQILSRILQLSCFIIIFFMKTACSPKEITPAPTIGTDTPTSQIVKLPTLLSTLTPYPSPTLKPATPTLPAAPVEGQTTSQLNVRSAPSANGDQVGIIAIFSKVEIIGKDSTSSWWMILYPESPTGTGWITTQFVQVPDSSGVPVIGALPQTPDNTPEAGANPTVASGNGSVPSAVSTLTLATAPQDGDSAQSPAVNMTLSNSSTTFFVHNSDLSAPEGDPDDWVKFTLEGQTGQETIVSVVLNCSGSSNLNLELIQNGVLLQGWDDISCGQPRQLYLYLFAGAPYTIRLFPSHDQNRVDYAAYSLTVQLSK